MKKLILILLFVPVASFGQAFTINQLTELFDLRSAESLMYKKGLRNIEVSKNYTYQKIFRSANCELDPEKKLCEWRCINMDKVISSEYEKSSIDFKNYEFRKTQRSNFADNYNSEAKTASSFIDISYQEKSNNGNCNNTFKKPSYTLNINIQFNNKSDFEYLKQSILEKAEYDKTMSYTSVPEARFFFLDEKRDRNIYFRIREKDNSGHIDTQIYSYSFPR